MLYGTHKCCTAQTKAADHAVMSVFGIQHLERTQPKMTLYKTQGYDGNVPCRVWQEIR